MKKRIGIIVVSFIMSITACDKIEETTNNSNPSVKIEFEDPLVKTYCVNIWDTDNDNELSVKEASDIHNIGGVFAYLQISAFTELQYFSGLFLINEKSFYECNNLTKISIPEQATHIKSQAFKYCNNLLSINLDNVESIESSAFYKCNSLKELSLINITSIQEKAFYGCTQLHTIRLGKNINEIEDRAFFNCHNLKAVYIESPMPPSLGNEVFIEATQFGPYEGVLLSSPIDCIIYVPLESVQRYRSSWGKLSSQIAGYDFSKDQQ